MIDKILFILFIIFFINLFQTNIKADEQFNFDVTELEILENGNLIKGTKKGTVKTNDGIVITSDTFIYNKAENIFTASGNVNFKDSNRDIEIFSENIIYNRKIEVITTNKNSKAIYNNKTITADYFKFLKNENILNANGNVKITEKNKDYIIKTEDLTYFKKFEKVITKGNTESLIQSRYEILSNDLVFLVRENNLSSKSKTKITDSNSQIYYLDEFNYSINDEIIKGEKVLIITNYNLPKSDQFYFSDAIIDLKNNKFIGKDSSVKIHKTII